MGDANVLRNGQARLFINEVFGPTIQGEGPQIGQPTWFVRFAGCDLRCSWCDTKYSWDTEHAEETTAEEIASLIPSGWTGWVCLTGGNPALYDLTELIDRLHRRGLLVSLETQGTLWQDWFYKIDSLVVSPKQGAILSLARIAPHVKRACLKIVVFDRKDLAFAQDVVKNLPSSLPVIVQPGTDKGHLCLSEYQWLVEKLLHDPVLKRARFLPQLHVLIWGPRRGV